MPFTFTDLGLPTPKTGEALIGATFADPDDRHQVVTIERAAYFSNGPAGYGWVLDTDAGTFTVYATKTEERYAVVAFLDTDGALASVTVGLADTDAADPWGRLEVAREAAITLADDLGLAWVSHVEWVASGDMTPEIKITAPQSGCRLASLDEGEPVRFFFDTEGERRRYEATQNRWHRQRWSAWNG